MASEPYAHYVFRQNNSGGYFVGPEEFVVTATSEKAARTILESQPWYTDEYCDCCGPRWGGLTYSISDMICEVI